jgi:hypothetical protein
MWCEYVGCLLLAPVCFCEHGYGLWVSIKGEKFYCLNDCSTKQASATWRLTPWRQNLKVHHRVHNSPPTIPILSQVNPLHTVPADLFNIHVDPIFPSTPWSSDWFFPLGFPTEILHTFLFCRLRATCPYQLILLELTCVMIFGGESKLWSSPVCNFLRTPFTSSHLGPNILLSTLFSDTLSLLSSLMWETKFRAHTKPLAKLWFCVFSPLHS